MLTITNVKKTFNKGTVNEKKALNGINLHLAPGDFVTIIGGNGAGKSTMLNMIAGVYPIDSGKIEIDGVNISREPEYKRALPGSDARHCRQYGDTGKPCHGTAPRQIQRTRLGHQKE